MEKNTDEDYEKIGYITFVEYIENYLTSNGSAACQVWCYQQWKIRRKDARIEELERNWKKCPVCGEECITAKLSKEYMESEPGKFACIQYKRIKELEETLAITTKEYELLKRSIE